MEPSQTKTSPLTNPLAIPIAIVIAGAIIGGALLIALRQPGSSAAVAAQQPQGAEQSAGDLETMRPITDDDHIRGNINAPVKIVEYSDTECPYCKTFHATLQRAVQEYGDDVAWVYRHFPLDQLHSKARKEAVALECAAEHGGPSSPLGTSNDVFWKYADRWYELTPSNDKTNIETVLPQIAREIGLDESKFAACLGSKKFDAHIEDNVQNAQATGGNGTPWTIVVAPNGKKYPLSGAQPYEAVKQLIDLALQEK